MTHHVYFARVGSYVKIGHSGDVRNRLYSIKCSKGWRPDDLDQAAPVELLRTIPDCTIDDESMVHYLLREHNAVGEWFHATDELLAAVAGLVYVPDPGRYAKFARNRQMMRRIRMASHRRAVGRLTLAAAVLALPLTLTAAPAHADYWCNAIVVEDSGHTVGQHCDHGPAQYDQYRIVVQFCSASGCWSAVGNWKDYGAGGRSKASSTYGTYNQFLGLNGR